MAGAAEDVSHVQQVGFRSLYRRVKEEMKTAECETNRWNYIFVEQGRNQGCWERRCWVPLCKYTGGLFAIPCK